MTNTTQQPLALITGVGPGVGSSLVRRFAEGGYRNLSKDKVDSLSAQIIFEGWYEQQA